jgi:hypothetical protein
MSAENKDPTRNIDPQAGADMIVAGVIEVLNAALSVGATVAKTIAQQTSGGKSLPEPEGRDSALNDMVHYGVAAVTNVVGLVVSGAGVVSGSVKPPEPTPQSNYSEPQNYSTQSDRTTAPSSSPSVPNLPTVHQGSTLRIPLSIENPSSEPMSDMTFVCLTMSGETAGSGQPLDISAVRFQPQTLSIAPKDFEKLTVFIETYPDTTIGLYKTVIDMGKKNFETVLQFQVIPAVQN